jgi:hypothetical protein
MPPFRHYAAITLMPLLMPLRFHYFAIAIISICRHAAIAYDTPLALILPFRHY